MSPGAKTLKQDAYGTNILAKLIEEDSFFCEFGQNIYHFYGAISAQTAMEYR